MPADRISHLTDLVLIQIDRLAETWAERGETDHEDVTWAVACEHRQIAYAEAAHLLITFSELIQVIIADEQTEIEMAASC